VGSGWDNEQRQLVQFRHGPAPKRATERSPATRPVPVSGGSVTASNANNTARSNALSTCQARISASIVDHQSRAPIIRHCRVDGDRCCTQATASDANGYVGSDRPSATRSTLTIANTTTGAADKCVYPTRGACPRCRTLQPGNPRGPDVQRRSESLCSPPVLRRPYVVTDQLDSAVTTNADQGLAATVPFNLEHQASSPVGRRRTRFRGPGAAGPHRIWKAGIRVVRFRKLEGQYTERSAFSGAMACCRSSSSPPQGPPFLPRLRPPIRAPSRLPLCN